jgi:hypothetical protein
MIRVLKFVFLIIFFGSCTKEHINIIPDNEPVSYTNISKLKIENYVNRLFIDLIGREPLKIELNEEVEILQEMELSRDARLVLIDKLMNDDTYREDENSYKAAFYLNMYNLAKVRCLEGVADEEVEQFMGIVRFGARIDSIEGNWDGYYKKQEALRRYQNLLDSQHHLYEGHITYNQIFSFIVSNGVYDRINMNTFNFVRAVYDELLFRLPTQEEFQVAFDMVEFQIPGIVFGKYGSDKDDFVDAITESPAMMEGLIIWTFQTYLNRFPNPAEMVTLMPEFIKNRDIRYVIKQIAVTDEYASFK